MRGEIMVYYYLIIFALSFVCLITERNLFYNVGIFVDEFNLSPDVVYGGEFWLCMDWIKLLFIALIVLLSGINLFLSGMRLIKAKIN